MTRWLVGVFDPSARAESSRLAGALEPHEASLLEAGALRVAYTGPPPATGRPLCLLDGFLDNARELSAELGLSAQAAPEELLASGWLRWGAELLPRLRGDFALVVWDGERGEGLLARDQLGVRSLFLHESSGALAFAGEIRHLLAALARAPAPDPVGVAHWIAISGRPGAGTLYEGVRRLDPGTALMLGADGARERRYWAPRFVEPLELAHTQLVERLRSGIELGVARRLSPDGVTGVLMSGGLDSSAVAAVAAERAPEGTVAAYSAEFPDHPAVDESQLIEQLRGELGLGGVSAEVRAGGLVASAMEWTEQWRVPLTSWGEFWAGPLLRAASREGVRTVLGGDGGDELFGCRSYLLADRLRAGHPRQALALARALPGAGERPPRRALVRALAQLGLGGAMPAGPHRTLDRPAARRRLPRWLLAGAAEDVIASDEPLAWKRLDGPRWWAHDAWALTRGVEELGIFESHRRRAAQAGVHNRHPLFDLDLLELGLRQPPEATFDPDRDRPLLRASMAGLLPDVVRLRPVKALFDSLLVDSLAGSDGDAVRALLSAPRPELAAFVDMAEMRRTLLDRGPDAAPSRFRWMYQVWRLVTAECWLRSQAQHGRETSLDELRTSAPRVTLRAVSR
ncbi:MAG TPA: asparagine synthase-related protein [Solirubrobacteraceae bacterium]|nr:asparagine synthase-related protein [Solirubrobacteraceae bacterium]